MMQHLIPQRQHTGLEDSITEDLYEIVGKEIARGTEQPWAEAILNFHLSAETGTFELRSRLIADDSHPFLQMDTELVASAFSELCYRMAEAGHGWNVATYRLTSAGEMNVKFGVCRESAAGRPTRELRRMSKGHLQFGMTEARPPRFLAEVFRNGLALLEVTER